MVNDLVSLGIDERRVSTRDHAVGSVYFRIPLESGDKIYYGNLLNKSDLGAGICTNWPLDEGMVLEIYSDLHWKDIRKAVVGWCKQIAVDFHKSGLIFSEL